MYCCVFIQIYFYPAESQDTREDWQANEYFSWVRLDRMKTLREHLKAGKEKQLEFENDAYASDPIVAKTTWMIKV